MNESGSDHFRIGSASLDLEASVVPWDCAAFGFRVAQIYQISVHSGPDAAAEYLSFQRWCEGGQIDLTACRLRHDKLQESMFLERHGFRFIEMVLHPSLAGLQARSIKEDSLSVSRAAVEDLPRLQGIAERAFGHERYHVDPRVDRSRADLRYANWVRGSLDDERQNLFKVMDGHDVVGLFITENKNSSDVYWHLTAVSPDFQGRGYGRRAWNAMLRLHQSEGCDRVTTTISARNVAVLRLYGQMGFDFLPPEMTFHWFRDDPWPAVASAKCAS
jgi:GNAT superfamily N-acetyltransferase